MKSKHMVASAVLMSLVVVSLADRKMPFNGEMKDILEKRKSIAVIRSFLDELDYSLEQTYKRRGCDIHLPGFNCDTQANTDEDANWWSDEETPGKKRGACFNADGSSCDTAHIAQEIRNLRPWMSGPGRRKRGVLSKA